MPTYEYECEGCGEQQEKWFSMSARPSYVPCSCGLQAKQVILSVPDSFVRFREYQFDPKKKVGNNGKKYGRTVEQQHAAYQKKFAQIHKNVREANRSLSKNRLSSNGIQYLGGMPGEMADSIGQQEGDKEAVAKDPGHFLKKTGLYVGEGQ